MSLASILERLKAAKQEIDLARQQSTKPRHLDIRLNRSAIQAVQAIVAIVDEGFGAAILPESFRSIEWILDGMRKPKNRNRRPAMLTFGTNNKEYRVSAINYGSGCAEDGSLNDDTALNFWILFVFPVLRSTTAGFKGGVGGFNIPSVKTDDDGRVVDVHGDPLKVETHSDGSANVIGKAATTIDDFDEADLFTFLISRAADWSDACQVAIETVEDGMRTSLQAFISRSDALVTYLSDGFTDVQDTIRLVNECESFRHLHFQEATNNPGFKFREWDTTSAWHFWGRHPVLEDVRDAYFDFDTITRIELEELRQFIIRTISAWALRAKAFDVAAEGKTNPQNIEVKSSLSEALAHTRDQLSGQSLRIFNSLQSRKHKMTYESLRNEVWEKNVSDKAIKTAVERLAKKLNDMEPNYFSITNEYSQERVAVEYLHNSTLK